MSENMKCPECGSDHDFFSGNPSEEGCEHYACNTVIVCYQGGGTETNQSSICKTISSLKAELEKANEKNRALEAMRKSAEDMRDKFASDPLYADHYITVRLLLEDLEKAKIKREKMK